MNRETFENPGTVKELGEAQSPLWFWNDALETGELNRQLALMTEKGVTCNAPHARTGFAGGYLDEDWMKHIGTVIDYKKEHNETMWLYDEFNWPAGTANGEVTKNEEFRERFLTFQKYEVPAGTRFRLRPVFNQNAEETVKGSFEKKIKINNIFCYDAETMEPLALEQFQPENRSEALYTLSLFDFEILRDRDTVVYEAKISMEPYDSGGIYEPDYMKAEATRRFVDLTYEAYRKEFPDAFGKVITASFNDETRFSHAFPWTEKLPEEFEARYGYSLQERLPDLILPGDEAGRTRCDYYNLIADLYRDNYHGVIRKWCEDHQVDYCPHLLGEETMAGQVRFSGEYMRQMKEVTRPGIDHLGKGIGSLNIRFASSATEVYGKKGLVCEVFAASGWELTADEYDRMISWLYSQGVQTITNHGFFYSIRDFRKDDWPPSQFFQWDGWNHMKESNQMCRRLYGVTMDNPRKTDVLIYHPVETYWLHYLADQNFTHGYHLGPIIQDQRAAEIDRQEQDLLSGLQEANRDFTVLPGAAIDQFEVCAGALVNKNTKLSYHAVILPMCEVLPLEVAQQLLAFVKKGGRLAIMEKVPVYSMKREQDAILGEIMKELLSYPAVTFWSTLDTQSLLDWLESASPQRLKIVNGIDRCKKTFSHYPDWVFDPYIHTGEDMDGISWTLFEGQDQMYYFVNYSDEDQEITVETESDHTPEIWDTMTGEIRDAQSEQAGDCKKKYRVTFTVPKDYGIFLKTDAKGSR